MAEFITPLQLAAQYGHSYVCKYLYDNMYCVWSISLQMTPIPLAYHYTANIYDQITMEL